MKPAQLSLLDAAVPSPQVVNRLRDQAIERVARRAEEAHRHRPYASFADEARHFVVGYLRLHGPTAGEVLTVHCKNAGIVPHDDRAFGAVYLALVKQKRIEKVGTVKRLRGHNTGGGNVWGLVR